MADGDQLDRYVFIHPYDYREELTENASRGELEALIKPQCILVHDYNIEKQQYFAYAIIDGKYYLADIESELRIMTMFDELIDKYVKRDADRHEIEVVFINNSDLPVEKMYVALSQSEDRGVLGFAEISAPGPEIMTKGQAYSNKLNYDNMPFLRNIDTLCLEFYTPSREAVGSISYGLNELWGKTVLCILTEETKEIAGKPQTTYHFDISVD